MHWNTVTPLLRQVLEATMQAAPFDPFRLVGGTSLSLQLAHRLSVDIDLFTDRPYGSVDFDSIDQFFRERYKYVATNSGHPLGMGASYYVGVNEKRAVKVDLYYTDPFIRPFVKQDGIRLAHIEDIIAMKLEVISRGGRKKDFWDLHELYDKYPIAEMIRLYEERNPYGSSEKELRSALTDFSIADDDLDPVCLNGKHWELIKLDFVEWLGN